VTAPQNTLLHAAYNTMIASLKADHRAAFDRDDLESLRRDFFRSHSKAPERPPMLCDWRRFSAPMPFVHGFKRAFGLNP
jgi:hypothetical protein